MRRWMCGVVATFSVAVGAISTAPAGAAIVPTIDFDVASDYTNNFLQVHGGSNITHNATAQKIQISGQNAGGSIRYDTNPGDGLLGPTDFLTETLSADVTLDLFNSSSVGFFTRMRTDNGLGILALVNFPSATNMQLRFFPDAQYTHAQGSAFYDQTFTLTNQVATNTPITLKLTQTSAADPVFNLTVSDAEGLVATSGNVAFTANDSFNGPGTVGIRLYSANVSPSATITVDNFSAVPEPSTLGVLALASVGLFARRRRVLR